MHEPPELIFEFGREFAEWICRMVTFVRRRNLKKIGNIILRRLLILFGCAFRLQNDDFPLGFKIFL